MIFIENCLVEELIEMNSRERFNAIMDFEGGVKNLKTEYGYWAGVLKKWFDSGLPEKEGLKYGIADGDLVRMSSPIRPDGSELVDKNVMEYFNLDPYPVKFPFDFSPMIKKEIIEDASEYRIFKDEYGLVQKSFKKKASVPMTISYPVKTLDDFRKYTELYDQNKNKRIPKDWDEIVSRMRNRDFPLRLGGNYFGFSGIGRHIMGEVNYMLAIYDDPGLLKTINNFYLEFVKQYWEKILVDIDIDWVMIWEDMAYKTGSFISKESFQEFLSPYYIELIDFIKQYRVKNIIVDSDGLVEDLIPLWIETGVTGIFPMESVNDLLKIRRLYPKIQMLGGVNKKILIKSSNQDINDELEKISALMKQGGFIPHIDHSIPMDADWERFKEYRIKLNRLIDEE